MIERWEDRKRKGMPNSEDVAAGRCLSPAQIDALADGAEIEVVWSGGNGPHIYNVARIHGYVTTHVRATCFDPTHDKLFDEMEPTRLYAWVERSPF